MTLKKSIFLVSVLALMLVGAGCGNNNDNGSNNGSDNGADGMTPVPTETVVPTESAPAATTTP